MNQECLKDAVRRRRKILTAGTAAMLFTGIIYGWSILKAPLSLEFGWSAPQLALNFTLTFCFFSIGNILASAVKGLSPKCKLLVSAVLVLCSFLLSSRLTGEGILILYSSYGILGGLGIGISYNTIVSAVNLWFPDKSGTSSGILMLGFGVSALILGKLANYLIEIPDVGWRKTYVLIGAAIGAALVLAAFILRAPEGNEELPEPKQKKAGAGDTPGRELGPGEMLRRSSFYMFFAYAGLIGVIGNSVFSFARDFAISVGASANIAATLVGLCSVCNGLGRILCGFVYDKKGRRRAMLLANLLAIAAPALALTASLLNSPALGALGLCCVGLSYGCAPTIVAAFTADFYGRRHYAMNYSIANTNLIPASFAATFLSAIIAKTGSYAGAFILLSCCALLALALNLRIRRP